VNFLAAVNAEPVYISDGVYGKRRRGGEPDLVSSRNVPIAVQLLLWAAFIYAIVCLAVWLGMRTPPVRFLRIASRAPVSLMFRALPVEILWKMARAGRLRPGDTAPHFRLPTPDQTSEVVLSSHRGVRPVLLVFGSYT
jgi:hypothetical protein